MKKAKNRKMPEYLVRKKRYYKMFDSIFQNQIKELSKQGQSIRGIARKLGISRQSVRKYMNGTPKYKAPVQDSFNNCYETTFVKQKFRQDIFLSVSTALATLLYVDWIPQVNGSPRILFVFSRGSLFIVPS